MSVHELAHSRIVNVAILSSSLSTMSLSAEALEALLAAPALAPPAGVTPDFDNPPNQNGLAFAVTTFCMVVATICLAIRAYSRLWLERKTRVEEGTISCLVKNSKC